ncbi:hypothetical protein BDV32DRAFT_138519 [Aspergillus pseudonomiae]|uniref:Uncharacterized protein n=1 Tax=Aspergillus pseudonomiae TaxID=1506151 RepID=A0A5N7DN21_9EURO|nr:uncharacterized protein BDV37DRAFT_268864 [Aspergillus pseudonomiae]KAB8260005.1 hypothetical protein BDV32DRAFT_138519 [Aspergillus pseudonomiae]KAE8407705.1 hypothetical protein BDV37DRAFT_268864 [Aspergillus pseudonomiae]
MPVHHSLKQWCAAQEVLRVYIHLSTVKQQLHNCSVTILNKRTTVSCPFSAARDSGVRLKLSLVSASTTPVSISSLTKKSCPFSAARDSGVRPPSLSFEFTSASPVPRSSLTTVSCPNSAAHPSAVDPVTSFEFTSALPVSRRILTTASYPDCAANATACPYCEAQPSGARPSSKSTAFGSTCPVSSRSWTTCSCPFIAAMDNAVKPVSSPASSAELSEFHALNRYKYGLMTA